MSRSGQVSVELLAVVSIIMLIFLGLNMMVSKRSVDIQIFRDSYALEDSLERVGVLIGIAQYSPGVEFNVSLPSSLDSCIPLYRIEPGLLKASCGRSDYVVRYLANVTGSSVPPFNISSDITIRGDFPAVRVLDR